MTASDDTKARAPGSLRATREPLIARRIWILGSEGGKVEAATKVFESAGHEVRSALTGAELAPTLREFRPNLIIIDMSEDEDRGRHIAAQLRADRATRQLPIVLVGATSVDMKRSDKPITGPTRRYTQVLDAPSVLNAILAELI